MSTEDPNIPSPRDSAREQSTAPSEVNRDDKLSEENGPIQTDAWIRYFFEFQDYKGSFKSRREVGEQDAEQDVGSTPASGLPAFERVTVCRTEHDIDDNKGAKTALFGETSTYIRIYSGEIIHALRTVTKYYPSQDLNSDVITVHWPYPILVHHYDQLREFGETCDQKDPSDRCIREKYLRKPLSLLLGFLDKEVMTMVNEEKERNKRGYHTYDSLWVAYEPGTTIMYKSNGEEEWESGVIHSVKGGVFAQPREMWIVTLWTLKHSMECLGRSLKSFKEPQFDGEGLLGNTLFMSYDEATPHSTENEAVQRQIEYGKAWWDLIVRQCRFHDGYTVELPKRQFRGMVMADLRAYYETIHPSSVMKILAVPGLMEEDDLRDFQSDCRCQVCRNKAKSDTKASPLFGSYNSIYRTDLPELTDHQYLLCPTFTHVFVFQSRTWERVHVRSLSPPKFHPEMMESLVMDSGRQKTLKSLTESFARVNCHGEKLFEGFWAADFVEEKGNGLIFLLHGGPGVGKTFTAECIAHSLKRPLMILTTSDISTEPELVEKKLLSNFKLAKSWNAVLLIDEADIFLARRTIEDLRRSSLVASFLRALEFYDGILFLTTNRVGAFDDAILSRVHIQLYYPDLDEDQRGSLWMAFIKKLEAERPNMQVKYSLKEYLRSKEMHNFKMNGREIRNAFQTAVALAEHRAELGQGGKTLLTEEHLREVIEQYRSFKHYFSGILGSEGRRAHDRGERLDSPAKLLE